MRVFVYGTLRQGHSNHNLILGHYTHGELAAVKGYTLRRRRGLLYAVPLLPSSLAGEVYTFPDDTMLKQLDWLEGYNGPDCVGNHYNRVEVDANGPAWMYVDNQV